MPTFPGRRILPFATVVLLALFWLPTAAVPAGQIVVFGARSGTHLTIGTQGGGIVVEGAMGNARPHGCQLSHGGNRALCGVADNERMEIIAGSSGDYIEVVDPLPIPLTVHLGDGSDKFIGNDEPDTCYSEGARRNRCIGNGGDDICITGAQNSDCVGGPGDDYCRTEGGSDGCWGGPGNDFCYMGAGEDGCHGDAGNDRLYGGADPDQLYGGAGWDFCDGGAGVGRSHDCEAGPGG